MLNIYNQRSFFKETNFKLFSTKKKRKKEIKRLTCIVKLSTFLSFKKCLKFAEHFLLLRRKPTAYEHQRPIPSLSSGHLLVKNGEEPG